MGSGAMRRAMGALCCVVALAAATGDLASAEAEGRTGIALLLMQPADRQTGPLGPEADTACEVVGRLTGATVLVPAGGGTLVTRTGQAVSLDRFQVVWCHGTDPAVPADAICDAATLEALRQFVSSGRGLLLSGSAAALVGPLAIDAVRIQPVAMGDDRGQAGLIPLDAQHPAFRGVDLDRRVLWMSNAVFPACAAFHPSSQPAKGRILAETPGGPENPLVEYQLGRGRVIAMAWRLGPLYADAAAEYRTNFERLAANLVDYLADAATWQPLAMQADGRPLPAKSSEAVSEAERRSLELAVRDLIATFGDRYPQGADYLARAAALRQAQEQTTNAAEIVGQFRQLRDEALLANPLLDFRQLLLVKRGEKQLGLPANYLSNSSLPPTGYDNEIALLSPVRPGGAITTLYRPEHGEFVGDVDLHFDADRLLFSMPDANRRWQVFEIHADGTQLRRLPLADQPDVDNYDACYLPDGRVVFCSTACFTGVPCINGTGHVCNLYLWDGENDIRQLTVEQDHDWCPTVLNSGRLLYLRWEYTDLPHGFSRILFQMNPDGTGQTEYYGSNSYWPASMFYARPIPNHPTKVVAIVGGHHELPRMGDLVIFDPARGRFEADGAVQRIPGRGRRVSPAVLDLPIAQSWPKFLHPYPLSDKYFLVACRPAADALWGIYLVDVFDNAVLLHEEPGYAMFEPIPLRATPKPPSLPDKVDAAVIHADAGRRPAEVVIADVYRGPGLRGVPRGTIKRLRVISYQFGYQGMGAEPYSVGLDGPWDPKRVLGTAPVYEDGSAHFRVPAYTPIALQPLDAEGKAVQLMRSWLTAMPGEVVSCVGCHEPQNTAPPVGKSLAAVRPADEIEPWYGPPRGFDFRREVQPVLDKYCLGCHDGRPLADGTVLAPLTDGNDAPTLKNDSTLNVASRFSPSYYQLRRFVRTPTKESDLHPLLPWEFHAGTTRLVQMLEKGHHGIELDAEAWDRLITWIDLNAPAHGSWTDIRGDEIGELVKHQAERRRQMRRQYAGVDDDLEVRYPAADLGEPQQPLPSPASGRGAGGEGSLRQDTESLSNGPARRRVAAGLPLMFRPAAADNVAEKGTGTIAASRFSEAWRDRGDGASPHFRDGVGWPFDASEAAQRQKSGGDGSAKRSIELSGGVSLELVRIPAGRFVMGQEDGCDDERPACEVTIDSPFWMGRCEVTNRQFALFDPSHESGLEHGDFIQFSPGERGWTLSGPQQPVVRVSWQRAMAFCRWLSEKTGRRFTLPTEAQWEYACRAGTATPLWYGATQEDFSGVANLSDASHQAVDPFGWSGRVLTIPPWRPADARRDDRYRVSAPVGSYRPNPWGLFDMHGNVAEWTRSQYRPYPWDDRDGRNDIDHTTATGKKVVRGGSWYDTPDRCRSAFRQVYRAEQPVYDVGFRVICEAEAGDRRTTQEPIATTRAGKPLPLSSASEKD